MSKIILILLLLVPTISYSATRTQRCGQCRPGRICKHPRPTPPPTILQHIQNGLEINAGFRWDREQECTPCNSTIVYRPETTMHDPFFIGLGLRIPLTSRVNVFGNIDRDWVEAAHVNIRTGIAFRPFVRE